jgi:hypothetical protein
LTYQGAGQGAEEGRQPLGGKNASDVAKRLATTAELDALFEGYGWTIHILSSGVKMESWMAVAEVPTKKVFKKWYFYGI